MPNFKCNTCNKTIVLDNVYTRCMLTKNCTGTLSKSSDVINNVPEFKKQVFTFGQKIPLSNWRIKHPLNDYPLVMVCNGDNEIFDYDLSYIDNNTINIDFKDKLQSGMVQLSINNNVRNTIIPKPSITFEKVSRNSFINIAIHSHSKQIRPTLLMDNLYTVKKDFMIDSMIENSWTDSYTVNMFGNNHKVYTMGILDNIDANTIHTFKYPTIDDIGRLNIDYSDDSCYILLSSDLNPKYIDVVNSDELFKLDKYNKIYDRIVSIKDLKFSNNYIDGGELYISSDIINDLYPHIVIPNV